MRFDPLLRRAHALRDALAAAGDWLAPLGLRLLLAWEFWQAGLMKWRGENWFAQIRDDFPFPFDRVPVEVSWALATWTELLGALAILVGLGTRLSAAALSVLTVVAIAAVHWPEQWSTLAELAQGYAIRDTGHGNFRLPLMLLVMLLALLFAGPGKLSLDALLHRLARNGAWHR